MHRGVTLVLSVLRRRAERTTRKVTVWYLDRVKAETIFVTQEAKITNSWTNGMMTLFGDRNTKRQDKVRQQWYKKHELMVMESVRGGVS